MPIYRMALHECDGSVSDVDAGTLYADLDEARAAAIRTARGIMAKEISQGRLCMTCWIVISTDEGHAVETLPFGNAVEMNEHVGCVPVMPGRASA